ncbi:MAG: hypothetical protein ACTHN8_16450, partial [Angustibacter sp.]
DPQDHAGRPPGPPRLPAGVRRAAARISPVLALVLVAALAAGVTTGAWFAHRRASAAKEAAARGAVNAFALAVGFDSGAGGSDQRVAAVAVRVFNVGSRPLSIAAAKGVGALVDTGSRVTVITGDGVVRPERDALVRVRVPLRCDALEAISLSVPVRSQDGALHQLAVRDTDQGMLSQVPQALCAQSEQAEPMSVRLKGSLSDPALELTNSTDKPVTVSLDSGSPLTQSASQYLAVTTRPGLPVTVAPGATRRLALRLDVNGCHRDLSPLADGGLGYFGLRIDGAGDVSQMGVDLSALVGAALERSCH